MKYKITYTVNYQTTVDSSAYDEDMSLSDIQECEEESAYEVLEAALEDGDTSIDVKVEEAGEV